MAMTPDTRSILTSLRFMKDSELQQYAAMHKNDPFIFPLAFQESQTRKQMRAESQAMQPPQPKVADQALAQMAPQPQQPLPENVGIGQLPADNLKGMATGGIVAFDDGGEVPGYADGVAVKDPVQRFANQYRAVAEQVGQRLGVDPGVLIAQWGHETDWGRKTVGKYNFGNIKDVTGKGPTAYDKMEKSKSSYKSYDSPEAFANDYASLIERNFPKAIGAGSDVKAFSAGLQEGKRGAYATDPNYGAKLEKTFMSMIPPAQAAAVSVDKASAIPGQSVTAPAKQPEGGFMSADSFQRGAEALGLSRDVGRNVFNTMMAPTPLAPATTVPKAGPGLYGRAAAMGERIYDKLFPGAGLSKEGIAALRAESELARKTTPEAQLLLTGPQAKLPGTTIPVTQAGEGITSLVQPARMVPPGPEATRLEQMAAAANTRKAAQAAQGAETGTTATKAAGLAQDVAAGESAAEKIQKASMLREAEEAAQLTSAAQRAQAAKTGAALTSAAAGAAGALGGGNAPGTGAGLDYETGFEDYVKQMPKEDKTELKDLGRETAKDAGIKTKGWTGDDFIAMGLGILSGQSPNALTNIGEGGLKGLAMRQARIKEEADTAYKEALARHYGVDPFVQRLQALKDPENVKMFKTMKDLEREPMTREAVFKQFMSSPLALGVDPKDLLAAFQKYVQSYESVLGPIGGLPQGVVVTPRAP